MNTTIVFDVLLQKECEHEISFVQNGEVVLQSKESNHFLKFSPTGMTKEKLEAMLEDYKVKNEGQILMSEIEANQAEVLTNLFGITPEEQSNEPEVPVQS